MRHKALTYLLFFALIAIVASCQKVISLKLNNSSPQLIIEGNLTNVYGIQYVVITKSVPFTNTNVFPRVSGAAVSITDDSTGRVFKFHEDTAGVYSFYPMMGHAGRKYTMTVTTGAQTYTASSTMPHLVNLDSVTAKISSFGKNNLRTITANYQDPPDAANQYRFILTVNGIQTSPIFAFDDSFTNGRYVRQDLFESTTDIHYHDTVSVEMQCIDRDIYKYWFSLSQQQQDGPGGGTTPSNPPSNFNNNALGYFSAHTSQLKQIVVN
ncbi:MAG: DUF4249 domain-containing protein [Mucilaginibacter sp.]